MSRRRGVFFTPTLDRTGAPKLLVEMLRGLADEIDALVLAQRGGPLVAELESMGVAVVTAAPGASGARTLVELNAALARRWPRLARDDAFLHVNTVGALRFLRLSFLSRAQFGLHAHEMSISIATNTAPADRVFARRAARVLAVSEPVARALVDDIGIARERIDVVPGFVDPALLDAAQRARPRSRGPDAPFIIGGIGVPTQLKGAETWLRGAQVLAGDARFRFRWIGIGDDVHSRLFTKMVRDCRLEGTVEALPAQDPRAFFADIDLLWHCSWEDSMPLAVLEAMACGVPALVFRTAGGAADALDEPTLVLDVPDVDELVRRTKALAASAELASLTQRLRARAHARFRRDVVLPRLRDFVASLPPARVSVMSP